MFNVLAFSVWVLLPLPAPCAAEDGSQDMESVWSGRTSCQPTPPSLLPWKIPFSTKHAFVPGIDLTQVLDPALAIVYRSWSSEGRMGMILPTQASYSAALGAYSTSLLLIIHFLAWNRNKPCGRLAGDPHKNFPGFFYQEKNNMKTIKVAAWGSKPPTASARLPFLIWAQRVPTQSRGTLFFQQKNK